MSNTIKVGISDMNIGRSPDILVTFALGSCVGICLYDAQHRIGGLSHILLPDSTTQTGPVKNPYRFADSAIPILVRKLELAGARHGFLKAKIAGGAQMFSAVGNASLSNVGERNARAVKEALRKQGIPIIADDTGKNFGRTLFFNTEDGSMLIKSATQGEWTL